MSAENQGFILHHLRKGGSFLYWLAFCGSPIRTSFLLENPPPRDLGRCLPQKTYYIGELKMPTQNLIENGKFSTQSDDNIDNYEKCFISRLCGKVKDYATSNYLEIVESPSVRNIITGLRLDCNKLNDSKFRSKRFTTCTSNLCQYCPNSVQSVSHLRGHLLLHCSKPSIVKAEGQ